MSKYAVASYMNDQLSCTIGRTSLQLDIQVRRLKELNYLTMVF
jgi:hypothetical protein